MRDRGVIIETKILLCAVLVLVAQSRAIPQSSQGRPASTWELIRKSQMKKAESAEPMEEGRVLHFPKERSLGQLMVGDENQRSQATPFGYYVGGIRWEHYGWAKGEVKIPSNKKVSLLLYSWTWQNPQALSALKQLKPDDIYSLTLSPVWYSGGKSPGDECMTYVSHLAGLNTLNLSEADITSQGLEYLNNLKSLELLMPPAGLDDSGMVQLGKLKSLRALRIRKNNSVTDKGLLQLSNLKSLEVLALSSVHMTDEGLKVLSSLPSLKLLILDGNFTSDAALYLKDVPSLKSLRIDMPRFNDWGMENISHLSQLENLSTHWVQDTTDRGVAYLKNMPNLKRLDIGHAKITDKAMLDLKQISRLEHLSLPHNALTDESFKHIIGLQNLKYLWAGSSSKLTNESLQYVSQLRNIEELSIGSEGFSDEGMKHITKLTSLKKLSLFTANQLTNDGLAELAGLESLTGFMLGKNANVSISGLKSLNNLTNLKDLTLRDIYQDNSSFMDISGLTELEGITLNLHRIRKNGATVYESFRNEDWACLADLRKLKRLHITGVGIDNEGVKHLSGLINLENITIYCPGEERITDEALKYLANMHKLNRLSIKDGHFTDKVLDYLDGLPSLSSLELTSDYAFSNQAIRDFKRKNPNITRLQLMP